MKVRQGLPIVVSAPSGTGKTTLCRRVMADLSNVEFSVSHTTRSLRGQEKDGVDYHFVDTNAFQRLVDAGEFLEWANVYGKRYGTHRREAEQRVLKGIDVLFDIDIQGGRQIATRLSQTVLIFVVPPSMQVLEQRLRGRRSDSEEVIRKRLALAESEMREATFYSYWIVNDDLERAVAELKAIIVAERLRQLDKIEFVQQFMKN